MQNNEPIYRKLIRQVCDNVLSGALTEGMQVDSLQQVSVFWNVNPLTVQKAYQELVQQSVLELRRGRGYFVCDGALKRLLNREKSQFIDQQLPDCMQRARWLGLTYSDIRAAWKESENRK